MTVALLSASTLPFQIAFMMCSAFSQDQESRRVPPLLQEMDIAVGCSRHPAYSPFWDFQGSRSIRTSLYIKPQLLQGRDIAAETTAPTNRLPPQSVANQPAAVFLVEPQPKRGSTHFCSR